MGLAMAYLWGLAWVAFLLFICVDPFSGRFYDCYDARLVGTAAHQLTVEDAKSGQRRQPHTTSDRGTIALISGWNAGDDLLVCNNMMTNRSKHESALCGDFGCLAWWP